MSTQLFNNGEFELPLITGDGGSFRVNATVVAQQLGHRDAAAMVRTLEDDEKVLVKGYTNSGSGAEQDVWHLTEPGFYKVVGQRNINLIRDEQTRDAVYRFQRWVFHEVLPQIVRGGYSQALNPGPTWTWDEVSAQVWQRYGLDYKPSDITNGLRSAGWLKAGCTIPKQPYRRKFWHTGTQWTIFPHVLPELVADLVRTLQEIGEPQAQQCQLMFFPALRVIEGGETA